MKTYAFVGPSGTGKSYRAQMVANANGIHYIIEKVTCNMPFLLHKKTYFIILIYSRFKISFIFYATSFIFISLTWSILSQLVFLTNKHLAFIRSQEPKNNG